MPLNTYSNFTLHFIGFGIYDSRCAIVLKLPGSVSNCSRTACSNPCPSGQICCPTKCGTACQQLSEGELYLNFEHRCYCYWQGYISSTFCRIDFTLCLWWRLDVCTYEIAYCSVYFIFAYIKLYCDTS